MAGKPPDPWAKYYDWKAASAGDVASAAAHNFGPSLRRDIRQALQPVVDVFHPSAWPGYAQTAKQLAVGIGDKTAGWLGADQDPKKKAADEAAINAVGHYFAQRYGSVPALKQTLATDPAGALFDTSAALSIPAGGEGLAARLPGVVGKAAQVATKAARLGAEYTNPLALAGKTVSLPAKALIGGVQGPLLVRSGNLSARVQAAVQAAFPNGIIGPDELANPQFKAAVVQTMGKVGVTPAAAKQAVLAYHDIEAPRSLVSGKAPAAAARNVAQDMTASGRQRLGAAASAISGAATPSPTQLGSALEQAQIEAHNGMHGQYKTAFDHPGEYDPASLADLPASLSASLEAYHLPATPAEFAKYPSFVQSSQAYDWLTGHLADLGASDSLTMPNLERTRQELNQFRNAARGTDSKAVGAIIEGFDQHLQDAAAAGHFSGGAGAAADMAAARQAYRDYQGTFNNRDNPTHAAIAQAIKHLAPDQAVDAGSGMITAPATAGSTEAAQGALSRKLINPRTLEVPAGADKLYENLSDALNDNAGRRALDEHIRQTALATDDDGLVANSDKLQRFLQSPLAPKVYSPDELSKVRLLSAASDVLAQAPRGGLDLSLGEAMGHSMRQGAGALAGAGLSHVIGVSPEVGGVVGALAEQPMEGVRAMTQRMGERAGAKPNMGLARKAAGAGDLAGTVGGLATAPYEEQQIKSEAGPAPPSADPAPPAAPDRPPQDDPWAKYLDTNPPPVSEFAGGRVGRAAGGKVDSARVEQLVRRLIARSDMAKREAAQATKPLLQLPDAVVAKALDVAQRAI